jgi:hypothetical protein
MIKYKEHSHPFGGIQRIYDLGNGTKLSAINSPVLHIFSYAWEIALINDGRVIGEPITFVTEEKAQDYIKKMVTVAAMEGKQH